jgi:hypothetical protein
MYGSQGCNTPYTFNISNLLNGSSNKFHAVVLPPTRNAVRSERHLCNTGSCTEVGGEKKALPVQVTQFFPPGSFSD